MEYRPTDAEDGAEEHAAQAGGGPQPQQQENDLARVHVAVQPQRVRQRLGHILDHIEQKVERPQDRIAAEGRAEQFVDPAAQAFDRDGEIDHQQKHRQRQGEGGVDVGSGDDTEFVLVEHVRQHPGDDVDRQKVHRIHQQDPHEHREGGGRDEIALAVEYAFHLVVDEAEQEFDEGLALGRHAGGCATRHQPHEKGGDDAEDQACHQRIDVQRPERAVADRLGVEAQVVLDIACCVEFLLGSHSV